MTTTTFRRTAACQRGFTLIELMVTMVVAAILLAIAVPTYKTQIRKSRRTEARTALVDLAGREERYLSVANSYSQANANIGYPGTTWPQAVGSGYYNVTVAVPDPGFAGTGPSFAITATPIGDQANDSSCASFGINQIGQQKSVNSGGSDSSSTCWGG